MENPPGRFSIFSRRNPLQNLMRNTLPREKKSKHSLEFLCRGFYGPTIINVFWALKNRFLGQFSGKSHLFGQHHRFQLRKIHRLTVQHLILRCQEGHFCDQCRKIDFWPDKIKFRKKNFSFIFALIVNFHVFTISPDHFG